MPASYRILTDRNLVLVRYGGHVAIDETRAIVGEFLVDPARRSGMRQLIDLAEVTSFDLDIVQLMALQAQKAAIFLAPEGGQTLLVYYAPHEAGFQMARHILRSWQGISSVVATIQRQPRAALDVLGVHPRDSQHLGLRTS